MKRIEFEKHKDYSYLFKDTRSYWSKKYKKVFSDNILSLDIETSSAWYNGMEVIPYLKGIENKVWNEYEPLSLCYIWQFSYNDICFFGRELRDLYILLNQLNQNVTYICYVHNLSFEFQFLRAWYHVKSVFARQPHKPMKCEFFEFENIEFRCSYILTGLSLDNLGKQIGEHKLHTLDYDIIRTPNTILSDEELDYCIQDCNVVYKTIEKYRKKYNHICDIPLTMTGETRLICKKLFQNIQGWYDRVAKMLPSDSEFLQKLLYAYQGGYTHANILNSGIVHRGLITCYDFASSYPFVMLSEKYPMSSFVICNKYISNDDDNSYLLKIELTNLNSTKFNHYISFSKCIEYDNCVKDNGRIVSADRIVLFVTDCDLEIIKRAYSFNINYLEIWKAKKEYLPKPFVELILDCYENKTKLKGAETEEEEELYMQSKSIINALYGMCVSALLPDTIELVGDEWEKIPRTKTEIDDFLSNIRTKNTKVFLNFAWGVWISAYARYNLWNCILAYDEEVIYCDTDSIKMLGVGDFSFHNEMAVNKLQKMCKSYNINFERTRPAKNNKKYQIGLFAQEDSCSEFVTLGAKKYCCRYISDNKLHLTISGINKKAVSCLNNDINNFKNSFVFDKDNEDVTTKTVKYLENIEPHMWNSDKYDSYYSTEKKGINLIRRGYKIGITDEYELLLQQFTMKNEVLN